MLQKICQKKNFFHVHPYSSVVESCHFILSQFSNRSMVLFLQDCLCRSLSFLLFLPSFLLSLFPPSFNTRLVLSRVLPGPYVQTFYVVPWTDTSLLTLGDEILQLLLRSILRDDEGQDNGLVLSPPLVPTTLPLFPSLILFWLCTFPFSWTLLSREPSNDRCDLDLEAKVPQA